MYGDNSHLKGQQRVDMFGHDNRPSVRRNGGAPIQGGVGKQNVQNGGPQRMVQSGGPQAVGPKGGTPDPSGGQFHECWGPNGEYESGVMPDHFELDFGQSPGWYCSMSEVE